MVNFIAGTLLVFTISDSLTNKVDDVVEIFLYSTLIFGISGTLSWLAISAILGAFNYAGFKFEFTAVVLAVPSSLSLDWLILTVFFDEHWSAQSFIRMQEMSVFVLPVAITSFLLYMAVEKCLTSRARGS